MPQARLLMHKIPQAPRLIFAWSLKWAIPRYIVIVFFVVLSPKIPGDDGND